MLPEKRDFHITGQTPKGKKVKFDIDVDVVHGEPSQPSLAFPRFVALNPADCDLDFDIGSNGLHGSALYEKGFAYCWSGARANAGITGGKYCFGCKIISEQPVNMEDTPVVEQHVCRVGVSRGDDAVGNLGESLHSFGFGGTGKFSSAGMFLNYGEHFGVGDTIVCCIDLETKPASIGFSKNGKWLGIAMQFEAGPSGLQVVDSPIKQLVWESAFFPHILLKNAVVNLQFSLEDGLEAVQGYKPWSSAIEDGKALAGPIFSDIHDCELIMMVGLPASGKSTWAEKWAKEHPEKRYIVLGTNLILDKMKVPGLLRKHNYGERFERLMDSATEMFNTLLPRASKLPRNLILDQTNVYKNARKRKLKPFLDYKKIAVVMFPTLEEFKFRSDKRFKEMGKEVPADAVKKMLGSTTWNHELDYNFVLPMSKDMHQTDEYFDQVLFPELGRAESQRYLDEMKANLCSKMELSPFKSLQPHHFSAVEELVQCGQPVHTNGSLQGLGVQTHSSHSTQFSFPFSSAYHPNPSFSHSNLRPEPRQQALFSFLAAQYGPPCGTPNPRPSYGHFPTNMQQPSRYVCAPALPMQPGSNVYAPDLPMQPAENVYVPDPSMQPGRNVYAPDLPMQPGGNVHARDPSMQPGRNVYAPDLPMQPGGNVYAPDPSMQPGGYAPAGQASTGRGLGQVQGEGADGNQPPLFF